jgi:non-ribosomal peptide synthase protein (TIGR01720 family)
MTDLMTRIAALPPERRQLLDALLQQSRHEPAARTAYAAPRSPIEEALATIWSAVLGVERVGIHDSFFELGGDSIHSIQIVARARQAGIHLTNSLLFDHPTIARLSEVVTTGPAASPMDAAADDGDAPLTPIQHWFFELPLRDVNHWNQAVLLRTSWGAVDEPAVRAAFGAIVARHDALRLRFQRDHDGWRQGRGTALAPVSVVDLGTIVGDAGPVAARRLIDAVVRAAQRSLHLQRGPIVRLVLFRRGVDAPHLALLLAHHLVADAVSFRTQIEELSVETARARRGEAPSSPAPSATFAAWARYADQRAGAADVREEMDYWEQQLRDVAQPPADAPDGTNLERDARRHTITFDEADTSALRRARAAGLAPVRDILLAALYRTLAAWTGQPRIGLWLEGHGRDIAALDLSRTVGWLTTLFPVTFTSSHPDRPEALLHDVRQRLEAIPNGGQGFGLLRYCHPVPTVRASLVSGRGATSADVLFNYLGIVDELRGDAAGLAVEDDAPEGQYDPAGERPHALQVYGGIYHGRLIMHWRYSGARYRPGTIAAWADVFAGHVRSFIARAAGRDALPEAVVGNVTLTGEDIAAIVAAHEECR